jgi:hypothetical protein
MCGEDGRLYLSMAQELLMRELEVPLNVAPPPWVDGATRQVDQVGQVGHDDQVGQVGHDDQDNQERMANDGAA